MAPTPRRRRSTRKNGEERGVIGAFRTILCDPSVSSNQQLSTCSPLHETERGRVCVCSCVCVFMSRTQHHGSSGNRCQFKSMPGHEGAGATVQKRWGGGRGLEGVERGCQYTPFLLLIVAVNLHTFRHGGAKIEKYKCSLQSGDKLFFIVYCNHCNHTLRMPFCHFGVYAGPNSDVGLI